ncbi:hypothetical protein D1BOALGB6SA_583 [Olavius sp. associated proteobacterium Delta 1]|nr:hypothetical protein D1BOALGB6SA_583 [Olavius sp. associated proteobacterium Delta 1]
MMLTFSVYLIIYAVMLWKENRLETKAPEWLLNIYFWLFAGIFILAMDFWAWGNVEPAVWGIPLWVGYFVILSALQTVVMLRLIKKEA